MANRTNREKNILILSIGGIMDITINYYNKNAEKYVDTTVNADVENLHNMLLNYLNQADKILDLGCGSGRDSKIFIEKGYEVTSIDGSKELCKIASKYIDNPVECMLFNEISYDNEFDGIWACSSLLHVPITELPCLFKKISKSLKVNGYFYFSFKYGNFSGERNGRHFTDLDENSLEELLTSLKEFGIVDKAITDDVREGRQDEKWLNVVLRKKLKSFDPIIDENSEVLILGTFPSVISLENKQYYANPRNQFWKIIYSAFNFQIESNYEGRIKFLLDNKIAVWDVIEYAFREGSLDKSIKDEVPNGIYELLENYPNIHTIIFNGLTSEKYFKKYFRNLYNAMNCIRVSSTSPTPGRNILQLNEKKEEWKQIIRG
jgi:hypoxanthine-DNA glycosylase